MVSVLRRSGLVVAVAGAGIALAACGSSGVKPAAQTTTTKLAVNMVCASSAAGAVTQTVGQYTMVTTLGPAEMMYTKQQVAQQHPTSGEEMLRGSMAMSPAMGSTMTTMGSTMTTMGSTATTMGSTATTMASGMHSSTTMGSTMTTMGSTMTTKAPAMAPTTKHLEVHICTTADGKVVTDANPTITLQDTTTKGMATDVPVAVMEGLGMGTNDLHYGNNVSVVPGDKYVVSVTLGGSVGHFDVTA